VHYLPIVRELFPTVRCLLVFRHVMDTVASGIEASPWGFQAYGYESYVDASPRNTVAALASYWLDHVAKALQWETQYPEACHRVRYEDLVLEPEKTIAAIQSFLGVTIDLSVLSSAFDREPPRGPGDYKIEHTTGVHVKSIGHGKRVPVGMLPPPLLTALNIQLAELGYDELTEAWNTEERIYDGGGQGIWAKRLAELMDEVRISEESKSAPSFAVVAEDHMPMRWVIDPQAMTIRQGDGDVEGVLTGTAQDLVLMLTKEENLGVLLRAGRVRHMVAREEQQRRDLKRELDSIVAVLLNRRKSVNDR
jgi:hypothetical protein